MAEYTFVVQVPGQPAMEYLADVDSTQPLMENFVQIVKASSGTKDEIPTVKKGEGGEEEAIRWTFAWGDSAEEDMAELAEHLSLEEQGVFPGAEIIASDNANVGARVKASPVTAEVGLPLVRRLSPIVPHWS